MSDHPLGVVHKHQPFFEAYEKPFADQPTTLWEAFSLRVLALFMDLVFGKTHAWREVVHETEVFVPLLEGAYVAQLTMLHETLRRPRLPFIKLVRKLGVFAFNDPIPFWDTTGLPKKDHAILSALVQASSVHEAVSKVVSGVLARRSDISYVGIHSLHPVLPAHRDRLQAHIRATMGGFREDVRKIIHDKQSTLFADEANGAKDLIRTAFAVASMPVKRGRGRPKGSKDTKPRNMAFRKDAEKSDSWVELKPNGKSVNPKRAAAAFKRQERIMQAIDNTLDVDKKPANKVVARG